jgi:hypothetical protein
MRRLTLDADRAFQLRVSGARQNVVPVGMKLLKRLVTEIVTVADRYARVAARPVAGLIYTFKSKDKFSSPVRKG